MYRLVYVVNPLKSGMIDRIAIPDDAVELLRDYAEVVIRPNGEIRAIKDNSNGATLGWLIYKIPTRYIVHLDGNPLNFRRENIHDNRKMVNRAYLVFVALDENEHPVPVPRLILETEEERQEWEAGAKRHALRKQRRLENY